MPDTEHEWPPPCVDRISTDDVAPSERVAFWNRLSSEAICNKIVVTTTPGRDFRGVLQRRTYDGVSVVHVEASPATVRGEPAHPVASDAEYATLLFQEAGTTDNVFGDTRLRLPPGTAAVHLPPPFTIAFQETTRCIIVKLPADRLATRLGAPERLVGTRLEAGDTSLLSGFLHSVLAHESPAREPGWDQAIGDVTLDLIALAYRRHKHTALASSNRRERWQRVVHAFVEQHLADPALGAAMIAQRLGVTPRYVQVVFASMATTATAYIRERRLEVAAQLLSGSGGLVADVAHRVGFANLSHFYRSFRKRYGLSPGRYATR